MTTEIEQLYAEKGDTWPKILKFNYEKYGDSCIAMRCKYYGIWQCYTWKEYYLNVRHLALGLLKLGLEPGDKVCIIGDNAPQWYYAELATQAVHGASVGIYADLTPQEIKHIAENSDARFAIVQDQEQVDKLLLIKDDLPQLKKIIYWNYKGLSHYDDPILTGYREVVQLGEASERETPGLFERNVATGAADDTCALVYTSGTTGAAPKGTIHTYRSMRRSVDCLLNLDPWYENDNVAFQLPPAWINGQWLGIGCHLLSASILNFPEEPETQAEDIREIGPNIIFYGPRMWEGQAATIQARILGADVISRLAYRRLMPIGYRMAITKYKKQKPGLFLKMLYALAHAVLFRPLRDSLGLPNARVCYSSGATLSPDTLSFYHALNIPLKSLYSSTEGGMLAGPRTDDIRVETVGTVCKGAEVRVNDNGEFLFRHSGIFAGYYKDPDKTAEVLRDGWFHSGDCGFITEDGHVVVLDRLDDLVELVSGDKLAPQLIESRLKFSPYIRDAWILAGPDRAYTSAIIIINYDNVGWWAGQRGITFTSFAELSQRAEVHRLVRRDIDRVNDALPPGPKVRKWVNLHRDFDPDEAELTRNRKLRRAFVEDRYRQLVEAIYCDQTEVTVEAQGRYRGERTETLKYTISIRSVEGAD